MKKFFSLFTSFSMFCILLLGIAVLSGCELNTKEKNMENISENIYKELCIELTNGDTYNFQVESIYSNSKIGTDFTNLNYYVEDDIVNEVCVERNGVLTFYDKKGNPVLASDNFLLELKEN